MINKQSKIFIAGHKGMVGSSCLRLFKSKNCTNLITMNKSELDLTDSYAVKDFFKNERPDVVINAAAKVGGILINSQLPYEFLMQNMLIQNNLIRFSQETDVKKFIFLGSSCIYPKYSPQPIKETYLLRDSLEETNQWYALAKITGVKLCESIFKKWGRQFISLMPTNLYGPDDNFDFNTSHVLPALINKFHSAKLNKKNFVELWGDGSPKREFLHVNDLADAIFFTTFNIMDEFIYNVGSGEEIQILDLARIIQKEVGFDGEIIWNKNMPNGTPRKLLDSTKFKSLGWNHKVELSQGIKSTYEWFLNHK